MKLDQVPEVAGQIDKKNDLNQIISDPRYDIKVEPRESDDDGQLRRQKEKWVFFSALVVLVGCLVVVTSVLLVGTPNETEKRYLQSIITLLVGGLIGRAFK